MVVESPAASEETASSAETNNNEVTESTDEKAIPGRNYNAPQFVPSKPSTNTYYCVQSREGTCYFYPDPNVYPLNVSPRKDKEDDEIELDEDEEEKSEDMAAATVDHMPTPQFQPDSTNLNDDDETLKEDSTPESSSADVEETPAATDDCTFFDPSYHVPFPGGDLFINPAFAGAPPPQGFVSFMSDGTMVGPVGGVYCPPFPPGDQVFLVDQDVSMPPALMSPPPSDFGKKKNTHRAGKNCLVIYIVFKTTF